MIRTAAILLAVTVPLWGQAKIGNCPVFPADNIWNTPIDQLPVMSTSQTLVNTIGASAYVHADFGAGTYNGGPIGIPFITVPGTQTKYPATFLYWDESDPGPYAVPLTAPIEGGSSSNGDRHALAVDTTNCILYELYRAFPQASSWKGDSGAIFNLLSHTLRPVTWTSADAAGLPVVPGLVTYEEILAGEIKHAIRFTAPQTRRAYVWPARHYASSLTGTQYSPMGQRFRLKSTFDITPFPADVQIILRALKKYGMILADNGSAWFLSGKPDDRWNNNNLRLLHNVLGSNFEAVDGTVLMIDPNSGQARQNGVIVSVTPASVTLHVGRTQQFSASVTGSPNQSVTWSVNGVAGGSAAAGFISATGLYNAPSNLPNPATVTIQAASVSTPASVGSASATLLPVPAISGVSPSPLSTGNFTLTVNGVGFLPGSTVNFKGGPLPTTYVSAQQLRGTGNNAAAAANVPVYVTTPDGMTSNTVSVNVVAPITVTISPTSANVTVGSTRQFTSNTSVTWRVNGIIGGNSTIGTITAAGLYTTPARVPSPNTVTVKAVSTADTSKSASASVRVRRQQ